MATVLSETVRAFMKTLHTSCTQGCADRAGHQGRRHTCAQGHQGYLEESGCSTQEAGTGDDLR